MRNLFLLGAILMSVDHANAAVLEAVENGDIAALEQALIAGVPVDERNARARRPCSSRSGTTMLRPRAA